MINDASVVIGGGNWGIKEADVLGYKLINSEYYARDIDFANSTAAGTYTDSTGVVRRAPYNLLQQSNTFSTTWATALATVTIGQTGYDGTSNAWLLEKSNTDGRIGQSITLTSSAYTYSVYAKAGTKNWVLLRVDGASNRTAYFNLQTGVTGTATGCTSSILSVGDGWYRCSITYTDAITIVRIYVADANNDTSGTSGNILIQAAQLVEGTEALPYFPTTTRLNVPRIDYRNADGSLSTTGRLLLEPQRTNSIRNSSMVGAVAGSPGTLPTNWANINLYGLSRTIVAIGVENGLPYIDFRFNGTANTTENLRIDLETTTSIAASTGQAWSFSTYAKTISGTTPTSQFFIVERTSAGAFITQGATSFVPTSTLARFSATRTLSGGATVAAVQPLLMFAVTSGVAYDFTIRIAAPQMELGAYATTWIPTTTAAVTRNADTASRTGVSSWIGQTEGTIFLDFIYSYDDTTSSQTVSISDGTSSNRIYVGVVSSKKLSFAVIASSTLQLSYSTVADLVVGERYRAAISYRANDFSIYLNGSLLAQSSSGNIPPTSRIANDSGAGSGQFYRPVNQLAIFPIRLTNTQLAQLTTL